MFGLLYNSEMQSGSAFLPHNGDLNCSETDNCRMEMEKKNLPMVSQICKRGESSHLFCFLSIGLSFVELLFLE